LCPRRQLQHSSVLAFDQVIDQYDLPVRKFQSVMMCGRAAQVDLSEAR
jgi:hypothetical protein